MSGDRVFFKHRLSNEALHIDYLRLRCGREGKFSKHIKQPNVGAYIAFSEWDVVVFVPTKQLYPENLVQIYSKPELTDAIAGSAGHFSYLWDHDINHDWQRRLCTPSASRNDGQIAMLVSLRFTDVFRTRYGIGAELMFCNFLHRALNRFPGITAVIAHGLGWNDTTIVLKADKDREGNLVGVLTKIRYCTESQCRNEAPQPNDLCVVAATYSHVLGDLQLYVDWDLSFGKLADSVTRARLLVRVNPDVERELRSLLEAKFTAHDMNGSIGTELGHYNFSADLSEAFKEGHGSDPVEIIQGFRDKIDLFMREKKIDSTSFFETTTEITLREDLSDVPMTGSVPAPPRSNFLAKIQETPNQIADHASKMTRHRLAILLGTIATYLDDPVRSSVVGYLCRFLTVQFKDTLMEQDRAGQEDLCHTLEYALHQATDGLSQFQHDANSLGLSGRGGYSRLIQAVDNYVQELIGALDVDLMPLLTFGLRPSHEGRTLDYWMDIPFSTAFNPSRWYVVYHELAHMFWWQIFGWRLDAFAVWERSTSGASAYHLDHDQLAKDLIETNEILEEVFPNYLILNVVATGDMDRLARLMISRDLITGPRPVLIRSLLVRMVFHVLLDLHRRRRPLQSKETIDRFRKTPGHETLTKKMKERAARISHDWWQAWGSLHADLTGSKEAQLRMRAALVASLEEAASSLRRVLDNLEDVAERRDALYGTANISVLVADPVFKDDAEHAVRLAVHVLALRGNDYNARSRESFEGADPSAVHFGYVLAKIDGMCETGEEKSAKWMPEFAELIKSGSVFADGVGETMLSRLLADQQMNLPRDDDDSSVLISSLSTILALWHVAATQQAAADDESGDAKRLPAELVDLKVAERRPFPQPKPADSAPS